MFRISRQIQFSTKPLTRHFARKVLRRTIKSDKEEQLFLHPDWYRTPKPEDGPRGIDPTYPDPPFESYQARDPYGTYADPQLRRNENEPLHENYDLLSAQNFDIETTYSMRYMLTGVAIAGGLFVGAVQLVNLFDDPEGWRKNAVERELPYMHKYQPK